ncbi:unnamed protein product [Rotaria sp. Silwood2]|nr:unnamed protein product [Rotaria sp. Silwood2]CAF2645090.1 unnamed protein product [Rotaria sp. Silwood2]CAF3058867.1 unnamed protein product [Rotaria sp. Silwood2]CAF3915241.1 unnamed protein product [Rotaria sp. Silwood2]CAF3941876.1 unnamed protein product [Rotaria sp. Silwood2]
MLFSSSQPYDIPQSTIDSQYDTTTGYSSSSHMTKRGRPTAESNYYAGHNSDSATNPSSRQYQRRQQDNNYLNDSFSDISNAQYFRPRQQQQQQQQQQPMYSTNSPKRPIINFLLP